MTTQQDYFVKVVDNNEDHLYTTIFDSVTGEPFRIKIDRIDYYLSKLKRKSKLNGDKLIFTGEWIPSFVKTKEKVIGSPSSSETKQIASVSQSKAGKRRRGKRGRKK